MPNPNIPSTNQILTDILVEIQAQGVLITAMTAAISAQADDIAKQANYLRYQSESTYGSNVDITGIWDNTDRYL